MRASRPRVGEWTGFLILAGLVFFAGLANAQPPTFYNWSELSPPSRSDHTAIYDPATERMIIFGGAETSTPRDEVWTLSLSGTSIWTLMSISGLRPSARKGHSAIYDPVRQRMLVFGGQSEAFSNEVWALSLTGTPTWTVLNPAGVPPSARAGHAAIYDPGLDRMLVFGGNDGALKQDVWELTLSGTPTWSLLAPAGTPPAERQGTSAIYDPLRQRMLVFGGQLAGNNFANDTWALELSGAPAWSAVATTGTTPAVRAYHGAIYDPVRDRMIVVHGGVSSGFGGARDVAALSLGGTPQWQTLIPLPWTWRSTAVYDTPRDRVVIHGGQEGGACYNATTQIALSSSPPLFLSRLLPASVQESGPPTIDDGTAVVDPLNGRMVVFGGQYAGGGFEPQYNNTAYALALGGSLTWVSLGSLPMGGRFGHSASTVADGTPRMVIFGGTCHHLCSGPPFNDVWQLGFASGSNWQQLTPTGTKPTARLDHTSIFDPSRHSLIVFGGSTDELIGPIVRFNDVWELNLDGAGSWTLWTPLGTPPSPRARHTAIYDAFRQRMVVFGGRDVGGALSDVWALSLTGTPTWAQLTPSGGPPAAREEHIAVYDGASQRMLIHGGLNSDDAWALSLDDSPAWSILTLLRAGPDGHARHSAVLDNQGRMWLHGGLSSSVWRLIPTTSVDVPGPVAVVEPLLEGARPNPARSGVTIQLSLPDGAPARLDLIDLAGRTIATQDVGALGAGRHAVRLGGSQLSAGVYFARLVRGTEAMTTKVAVVP